MRKQYDTVYLDLDGVLADWVSAVCRLWDKDPDTVDNWHFYRDWGISGKEFWRRIERQGIDFYTEQVKPYDTMEETLELAHRLSNEVVIATSAGPDPQSHYGKRAWVNEYIGRDQEVIIIQEKYRLAYTYVLLVDDKPKNVEQFRGAGGSAIQWPRKWNKPPNRIHKSLTGIEYLRDALMDEPYD